jgi:hypothetical protein
VPALCPRIKLRVTRRPLGADRLLGEGTLEQIHEDLALLRDLDAEVVILDPTYPGEPRPEGRTDHDIELLEKLTTEIIDLDVGAVR